MIHGMVITIVGRWTIEINVAAQETACEFEASGEAVSVSRIKSAVRGVVGVGGDEPPCIEYIRRCADDEILVLRRNGGKVRLRCRIDTRCLGIIEHVAQAEAMEYSQRITGREVEPGVLLFEVQTILEPEPLRQVAGIQTEEFPRLIVAKAVGIHRKTQRDRAVVDVRFTEVELIL